MNVGDYDFYKYKKTTIPHHNQRFIAERDDDDISETMSSSFLQRHLQRYQSMMDFPVLSQALKWSLVITLIFLFLIILFFYDLPDFAPMVGFGSVGIFSLSTFIIHDQLSLKKDVQ